MTQKLIICGATHTTQIVHTDQWEPEWCGTGPTHRRKYLENFCCGVSLVPHADIKYSKFLTWCGMGPTESYEFLFVNEEIWAVLCEYGRF